jgi:quercetin dioxygenase-like cupin family protein
MSSQAIAVNAGLREFQFLTHQVRVHADSADTDGRFAVMEFRSKPGSEPPMHFHENEDEFFFVLEGQMRFTVNGQDRVLGPGESTMVKRGTPHTFRVLTPESRSLTIVSPGGFEEFFRELAGETPPSFERLAETAARHGSRFVR